ncbi:MAG: flagellar protein FlgN [Oscillospiraceae bacterium]|nr:flagellar protein FlgN [Oscillospiraceae bacterium]
MGGALEGLIGLLAEQKSALETMLELSWEERRIIMSGDAERLEEVVQQGFSELKKLNSIEKRRAAMHPAISAELGLPEKDVTVSAIAELVSPNEREAIKKLQIELTALLKQHSDLNAENHELLKAHFEYTEAMLGLMVDPEDPLNNFYGGDGRAAPERKRSTGFFDSSA